MDDKIDLAFLINLMDGDEKMAEKFLGTFKNQAPQQMIELRAQINDKNWEEVSSTAHSLKSQFNYMNLKSLAEQMAKIESLADENHTEEISSIAAKFEQQFSELMVTLL